MGKVAENVDAHEIVVIQRPGTGSLNWYSSAGWKPQWFGTVSSYPKRDIYRVHFRMQFNDGGHGMVHGSLTYDMPLDTSRLTQIHTKYGSREAVQEQLVQTVANKALYLTGPLMSSRESYAERKNDLIRFVEDQVQHGIYRTTTREIQALDPISGQERHQTIVELVSNDSGGTERQEPSVLDAFGIRTYNFAIDSITYDPEVIAQIKGQQELAMQVQTSIAQARQAEQRAITAQKNGEAIAAEARWRQEAVRAESVTVYQRRLEELEGEVRLVGGRALLRAAGRPPGMQPLEHHAVSDHTPDSCR